jgi:protein SCO1/2
MTRRFVVFKRTAVVVAVLIIFVYSPPFAAEDVLANVNVAFELVDTDGEVVNFNDFHGKYVLLAFGFTRCRHICPMIVANMSRAIKESGKDATGIFVSVDTERDTPGIANSYARGFGESMVGLSGSYLQVAEAARNFNITFVVTKSEDDYTVQHTPSIFLIGPDGELVDVFAMNTPVDAIAQAIR